MRLASMAYRAALLLGGGAVAVTAYLLIGLLANDWFARDLAIRARFVGNALQTTVLNRPELSRAGKIQEVFNQLAQDERLFALGLCGPDGSLVARSDKFPDEGGCAPGYADAERFYHEGDGGVLYDLNRSTVPVAIASYDGLGSLVVLHDASFVNRRVSTLRYSLIVLCLTVFGVAAALSVFTARGSVRRAVEQMRTIVRDPTVLERPGPVGTKKGESRPSPDLLPLIQDLRAFISETEGDRVFQESGQTTWAPKTLKDILASRLSGDQVLIVSNREPYIHTRENGEIKVVVPASGLVTALEPIMRACSGVWIAHGSGSADREVVDANDKVWVPPEERDYQLRRLWLSAEEEQGYYYGFANEGLWPLCHIAHTRPTFRQSDWEMFKAVNQRFADVVVEESTRPDPVVLVQDYHFALLPELIRKRLPDATVITFWHIPWPNPEAFGICPWRNEILQGLLGSTIMGFHTRYHCNNFLESVDRFVECRIDKEYSSVTRAGHTCAVRSYPISIEWPPFRLEGMPTPSECRQELIDKYNLPADCVIATGVERLDYTKGLIERFEGVAAFLERYPEFVGRFFLVQIASPSRTEIAQYEKFGERVNDVVTEINARFSTPSAPSGPILLQCNHVPPEGVFRVLRGADVCMVTSLHDGMNLVAKEFVAARDDEDGVLILSMFTGASRELPEALIVNPYSVDQCAHALCQALTMKPEERADRMRSMRNHVREFNVYRWAGRMLLDAAKLRDRQRLSLEPVASEGGVTAGGIQ